MRKKTRGEERDTTTHMIGFHVFTHGSHVTKFSTSLPRENWLSLYL